MSEMIERVARRILHKASSMNVLLEDENSPSQTPEICAEELACAALKALREPTDEMLDAGDEYLNQEDEKPYADSLWETMIDAALDEKGE